MNSPHPKPVVPDDSPYTAPGVAVWAPRLRLTYMSKKPDASGGIEIGFGPTDNAHAQPWAVPDDNPELHFKAVVHSTVQLEHDKEYFAYFVPVEEMNHDK